MTKRFRVAFSLAGEKRDFVSKVAAILAERLGGEDKILYDKYHEAEFANWKLGLLLQGLYHDESDLVVAVVCPDYSKKDWCGLEWVAIHAMLMSGKDREIMLCRFEHAKLQGLNENAGYVELDDKTPEQTAILILQRLALNEGKSKNYYRAESVSLVQAGLMTPNNLPRLQYFFGRELELQKIADALTPEARGWGALIDGPGGIGKTSLAIRAAELVPQGRFRRIIFLSSKERELSADGQRSLGSFVLPSYLEMLNAIAREIDESNITKSIETERSDLILKALREADALLVLDNLETLPGSDRDQLFAFLNRLPRGCSAIVTSRRRADASAVIVRLDRLEWTAARELILELSRDNSRLAKSSEDERRALYEESGGNPLLIRWISGQLGLGRCRNISAALDFLRNAPPENNPLEFIFGDLLDTFSSNETAVLAALTHFNAPIEAKFVAELGDLTQAAAQTALGDLAGRALVLPDVEERSFALVPMVADFLRRKRPEVVAETGNRLEQYAFALIVENGYNEHHRFPVLDEGWPTLAPALSLFVAGPNLRLQTVCNALDKFFEFTGRWDEGLSVSERAEAKAVAAGDHDHAGWRAYRAGYIYYLRQQAHAVLDCADRASAHWQTVEAGARERASAIQLRGHGHRLQRDYGAAITAYRESLELHRSSASESVSVAIALNWLANVEYLSGDLVSAERDYREALRVDRAVGFAEGLASHTGNLADLSLRRNDWVGAETLAREALTWADQVGRQQLIASNGRRLAHALLRQGKRDEALPYFRRSVDIYTKLGLHSDLKNARELLEECEE